MTAAIIGAAFEVANDLGYGFSERVYQRSLYIALIDRGLRAEIDVPIHVFYRGHCVGRFVADLVVNETVLVEVKSVASLEDWMTGQTLNYLKSSGGGVGLLVNFGRRVEYRRLVVGDPANGLPVLREQRSAPGGRRPPGR